MSDVDLYTRGFTAGVEAGRQAADMLAEQLEAAHQRANQAWELVTDVKADLAEQKFLADTARQALASALASERGAR